MDELKSLIAELTKTCKTLTAFLEYQYAKDNGIKVPAVAAQEKSTAAGKQPTAKVAPKAEPVKAKAAPKTVEEALGQPETPSMSEKESLDVAYKLAAKYIAEGDKKARTDDLRAYLKKSWDKINIQGLTHPQRMDFIGYLKTLDQEPVGI